MSDPTTSQQIATQNDRFRRLFGLPGSATLGKAFITAGVSALTDAQRAEIFAKVRAFDNFTQANDPHGEHDFGSLEIEGVGRILWKLDLYDIHYQYGSEDPADPTVTRRVLTVMLAEEY